MAILKSHPHNALHQDKIICKKKNRNIAIAQTNQFIIAILDKSNQVWILNKYIKNIDIDNNVISIISWSSFNIIIYNNHITINVINIADSHMLILSIHAGKISIICNEGTNVCIDKAKMIIHIQVSIIHSCISKNNIS